MGGYMYSRAKKQPSTRACCFPTCDAVLPAVELVCKLHVDFVAEVPEFPAYMATRDGRVFSRQFRGGTRKHADFWRPLSDRPWKTLKYVVDCLQRPDGSKKKVYRHHTILCAFVGLPSDGADRVRHLNDVKADNRLENLAWGNQAENMEDAYQNGTRKRGEEAPNRKVTADVLKRILELRRDGLTVHQIGSKLDLSFGVVAKYLRKERGGSLRNVDSDPLVTVKQAS